jgi:hypothetical protein
MHITKTCLYIYKLIKDNHVSEKPAPPSLDQKSKDCEAESPTELQHQSPKEQNILSGSFNKQHKFP